MKGAALIVVALTGAVAHGQTKFPVETEADRKPKLKTTGDVVIRNAKILTVTHGTIPKGDIYIHNGKIAAIGKVNAPAGTPSIDATGKVVMPGIVDAHVHRGLDTTNEGTDAIVAEGRVLDVLNPDAKNVWQAVASGETTALLLHGSANPVGAQSLVVKLKAGHDSRELPIPDAPRMVKFALGENVTRSGSSSSTRFPHTRMGVEAVYRRGFTQAREYLKAWADWNAKKPGAKEPTRDLRLEALGDILQRKIWVQCHSYRADEILMMVRLSKEFGFKIGAMQHALESYKVAPELAAAGVPASVFSDDWASKLEMYNGIPYCAAILTKAGVITSVHTDGTGGTTAFNLDAARTMRYGGLTEEQALKLITINPAKQLGVAHRVGSIEVGKDGDIVIWDGHPLTTYAHVNTTIIEGEVLFQRRDAFGVDKTSTFKTSVTPPVYVANPPVPKLANAYAITNATIHPVSAPVIAKGTLLIVDGKIRAVGTKVAIPKGTVTVDGTGMQVYPGFIDAGSNLGLTEFGQVGQATDASELGSFQPDLVAATAVNVQSAHIAPARAHGVTSVLTMPSGGSISGHASLMTMAGWTNEQMTTVRKAGLMVRWPGGGGGFGGLMDDAKNADYDDGDGHDMLGGAVQGPGGGGDGASSEVKNYFDRAAKYGRSHKDTDLSFEAMQPIFEGKVPVYIRVRTDDQIRDAVKFVKDHKLKAVLFGAADAWRETKLLKESGIPVVIEPAGKTTLTANVTVSDWDPYDTPNALPTLLERAGVKYCFMTGEFTGAKDMSFRVGTHCAFGLKPEQALRAMTLSAAEILGVDKQLGSLTPGKIANVVVTKGDVFEPSASFRYVFINGKPVSLATKQTELRDQYMGRLK